MASPTASLWTLSHDTATSNDVDTTSYVTLEGSTIPIIEDTTGNQSYVDPYWEQIPWAHPYWKQFNMSAIPPAYHYAVASWMTFFGITGTIGNFVVILTFIRKRSLRTSPNYLIINLAFSDMMFSAVNGFPLLTLSSINRVWRWGQTLCQVYGWFGGMFGFMSITTLAFVARDRYDVITKPLEAAHMMTKKRAYASIAAVWVWAAMWATPPLFGWGAYIPEGFQTDCTFDYVTQDFANFSMVFCMYLFAFMFPVVGIFYFYYTIVKTMFKHSKEMSKTAERMKATMSKADEEKRAEIKTAQVALITIGSYMVSWTPYAVVALLGLFYPHEDKMVTPVMAMIPVMLAKSSAAYNPIIYVFSHPRFREEIYKQCPWLLCCCKPAKKRPRDLSSTSGRFGSTISRTEMSDNIGIGGGGISMKMSTRSIDTVATAVSEVPTSQVNPSA